MQNINYKIILIFTVLFFAEASFAYHRENFLFHGPSVAGFGRGETVSSIFDDVSSAFYNPSLAVKIKEKTVTLSYYSLFEDSMYSYAGFGLPLNDTYSGAISLIDLRSGPVELRKNINDAPYTINTNQWACLISIARAIKTPVLLNAGLDLRCVYMDLNGYTGSGIGMDAGLEKDFKGPVLFGNKSSISAGFAVQNLVSPSIKLISESETYPAIYRLGAALSVPVIYRALSYDEITMAADLIYECNYLTSAIGIEYNFLRQYLVKCGYYSDHITIGTGYKTSKFHFDYAFDLSDYSNIHRLGISYFFEDAFHESKKYSLLKEAKQSLAKARKERKAREKEVRPLLKQAIRYYNKKYYLKATDLFKEIMLKYPEYETAQVYIKKMSDEINSTIRNNDSDIEKYSYASGYADYQKILYNEAINEWEKVLQINPQRIELIEYKEKTKNYLLDAERIKKEKELLEKVKQLFEEGVKAYDSSKWISCIKSMELVKEICIKNKFPESLDYNTKASEYINKSVERLSESRKTSQIEAEEEAPSESEIDENRAEKSYQDGLVLYAQGKLFDAEKSWELALRLNPNNIKAQKALKKIKEVK
ncbi:MAG: hypothetical protein NT145_05220 [Elusimicrobia bacterium]|nr:hypothetical protein [Elusimicrobiota bacterium]